MRSLLRELEGLAERRDVDLYLRLRWEFHAICYRASGRRRLVDEVERLFWRSERYNRIVLSTRERFSESVGRYGGLLAACEVRDGDAAERAVQDSIRWGVDRAAPELPSEADAAASGG
jgi:DNA-binding GntR family transcriptional regulator